jgi:hypothetical protein
MKQLWTSGPDVHNLDEVINLRIGIREVAMKRILLALCLGLGAVPAHAALISATSLPQNGVVTSVEVDTDLRRIRYTLTGLSPANLGDDYEQIGLKQPQLPLFYIDGPYDSLTWNGHHYINIYGSMYTPYASGWVWDGTDILPTLQMEYQQGSPPGPTAVFGYDYLPGYQFTGNFLGPVAGEDGNVTISLRGGGEVLFTMLIPELTAVPEPATVWLLFAGLLTLVPLSQRRK